MGVGIQFARLSGNGDIGGSSGDSSKMYNVFSGFLSQLLLGAQYMEITLVLERLTDIPAMPCLSIL